MARRKRTDTELAAVARIGARIKAARDVKGLSRLELAFKAGVSYDHLWTLERGEHEPKPATLKKLAAALGVSVKSLAEDPAPRANGRNGNGNGRRK
jgi:transcriptional regulator with XRE-family HTH domain